MSLIGGSLECGLPSSMQISMKHEVVKAGYQLWLLRTSVIKRKRPFKTNTPPDIILKSNSVPIIPI